MFIKFWTSACASVFDPSIQPWLISDDTPITYHRYNSWVASKEDPPHLTAFLPTSIKHIIIRFRVSSYPLAFQSTKHKKEKRPRSLRYCAACQQRSPCIKVMEDYLHFWIEWPAYSEVRKLYPSLLSIDATPRSILNNPDQVLLGKALSQMLETRSKFCWLITHFIHLLFSLSTYPLTHVWAPFIMNRPVSYKKLSCFRETCSRVTRTTRKKKYTAQIWHKICITQILQDCKHGPTKNMGNNSITMHCVLFYTLHGYIWLYDPLALRSGIPSPIN